MLGYPADTVWVRYDWTAADLPVEPPPIAADVSIREGEPGEGPALAELVVAAYASDPTWAEMMEGIEIRMRDRVLDTFGAPGSACCGRACAGSASWGSSAHGSTPSKERSPTSTSTRASARSAHRASPIRPSPDRRAAFPTMLRVT